MVLCKFCGIEREKNIFQHERMCPKNPERVMPSFKGKSEPKTIIKTITDIVKTDDDKTTGKNSVTITSPAAGSVFPAAPVESKNNTKLNIEDDESRLAFDAPAESPQKSWILEICIAIIFLFLAAIAFFIYFAIPEKEEKHE